MRMIILVACLWLATSPLQGKIVFYSHRDGNTEIYTMNSDGSNQTRITFHPKSPYNPAWSPNGRRIVFESYNPGDPDANIWVMGSDGANLLQLTFPPEFASYPDWSPDGTQIAFDSDREEQEGGPIKNEIYVMDTDGGNVKPVTDVGFASRPRWSPDGEWILFEGMLLDGVRHIYAIQPDGRGLWRVSQPKPNTGMLLGGWSPDGKKVVYVETVGFESDKSVAVIATLHPAGRQQVVKREPLPLPRWDMTSETWSIDGKSILFAGRNRAVPLRKDGNNWEIYRFRLRDGQITQLTNHPQDDLGPHEWDPRLPVSPQGLAPTRWGEIKSNSHYHRGIGTFPISPIP